MWLLANLFPLRASGAGRAGGGGGGGPEAGAGGGGGCDGAGEERVHPHHK